MSGLPDAAAGARAPLEDTVRTFRGLDRATAELEVRLGTVGATSEASQFAPGVDRSVFVQLLQDLSTSPTLTSDASWQETADHYFKTASGENVRTRVEYDSTTMTLKTTHTRKELRQRALVRLDDDTRDASRVDLAVEHPVVDLPSVCMLTYVRLKHRKRFEDVRAGGVVWRYELSKTWSDSTRVGVEAKQQDAEPTYEVEVELVDEGGMYSRDRTDAYVAESVLCKIRGLLGDSSSGRVLVHPDACASAASAPGAPRQNGARRGRRSKRRAAWPDPPKPPTRPVGKVA